MDTGKAVDDFFTEAMKQANVPPAKTRDIIPYHGDIYRKPFFRDPKFEISLVFENIQNCCILVKDKAFTSRMMTKQELTQEIEKIYRDNFEILFLPFLKCYPEGLPEGYKLYCNWYPK